MGKESTCNAGVARNVGLIPESGTHPGGCMETHFSILAWRIPWTEEPGRPVHGVTKSWTQMKWLSMHTISITCVLHYHQLAWPLLCLSPTSRLLVCGISISCMLHRYSISFIYLFIYLILNIMVETSQKCNSQSFHQIEVWDLTN